ncbi:syndecan 1, partial [Streptomyces sp. DpondAA-F4]
MGLGGWFRREEHRAAPAVLPEGPGGSGGSGDGPSDAVPVAGARGDDWDGGWQRVAPPTVTVARSSIGVSDGLRFRSGLASWQNPAFGGELGHAVLPSAPVGLIHGVTRPAPPARTTSQGGGPLLLRAIAPEPEPEPVAERSDRPSVRPSPRPSAGPSGPSGPSSGSFGLPVASGAPATSVPATTPGRGTRSARRPGGPARTPESRSGSPVPSAPPVQRRPVGAPAADGPQDTRDAGPGRAPGTGREAPVPSLPSPSPR